jgi:FMN phosphatase YigB (HAD superfamily)
VNAAVSPGQTAAPVAALLFDFGGTLDANGLPWKERFFRLWQAHVGDVSRENFDVAFYAADDALVGSLPAGTGLDQTVERLTAGLAERLGCPDEGARRRVASEFCRDGRRSLAAAAELFARLSRRYRLGIVSNFYGNLAAVCEEAGLAPYLGVALDSAAVGWSKPDPRIFRAALERLAVEPAEAVFVGDSVERDMAGARTLGMRHVRLFSESSGTAAGCCCAEDRVISSLGELAEIFL